MVAVPDMAKSASSSGAATVSAAPIRSNSRWPGAQGVPVNGQEAETAKAVPVESESWWVYPKAPSAQGGGAARWWRRDRGQTAAPGGEPMPSDHQGLLRGTPPEFELR